MLSSEMTFGEESVPSFLYPKTMDAFPQLTPLYEAVTNMSFLIRVRVIVEPLALGLPVIHPSIADELRAFVCL
jgi:hypothetical protein